LTAITDGEWVYVAIPDDGKAHKIELR